VPVFHPDHDELHGITVVLFSNGPRTYIGRWDHRTDGYIRIVDATYHEEGRSDRARDRFLQDNKTYGVKVEYPFLTVPEAEVTDVKPLREVQAEGS